MNLKVIITFYLLIWVIESYAQHKSFDVLTYYSGRNEITVEFMNFRSEEMVLLLDRGSFIKFYKVDEQHQLDKLMKYELVATDSMNILAKITYFIVDNNPLGKNPFFRKAALEIIKKMPKWKPGLKNGKAVRSYYTIPIMFKLK